MREWFGKVNDDLLARADREAAAGAKIVFWGETNALSYKLSIRGTGAGAGGDGPLRRHGRFWH